MGGGGGRGQGRCVRRIEVIVKMKKKVGGGWRGRGGGEGIRLGGRGPVRGEGTTTVEGYRCKCSKN